MRFILKIDYYTNSGRPDLSLDEFDAKDGEEAQQIALDLIDNFDTEKCTLKQSELFELNSILRIHHE